MPTTRSYLSWSCRFVIEYTTHDDGTETKHTRKATHKDLDLHFLSPRPPSPTKQFWVFTDENKNIY